MKLGEAGTGWEGLWPRAHPHHALVQPPEGRVDACHTRAGARAEAGPGRGGGLPKGPQRPQGVCQLSAPLGWRLWVLWDTWRVPPSRWTEGGEVDLWARSSQQGCGPVLVGRPSTNTHACPAQLRELPAVGGAQVGRLPSRRPAGHW